MSIESNFGQEKILLNDNRDKFCEVFSGRKRGWDKRFCFKKEAVETRNLLIRLREDFGEDYQSLSKKLEISISTLGRAAGGTAGLKPDIKHNNMPTTDYILSGLNKIYNQYQNENHYNI
jgi:hypothetical protein